MEKKRNILVILTVIVSVMLSAGTVVAGAAAGDTFAVGGIDYQVLTEEGQTGTVQVVGASQVGALVIPSSVEWNSVAYRVTEIGTNAFSNNEALTSVVCPETLTKINAGAFRGCRNLTRVDLSACVNLASIDTEAFYQCESLTDIQLSDCTSLSFIGYYAFWGAGLTEVTFPASLTYIWHYAFESTDLVRVDFSACNNLTSVGNGVFYGCEDLVEAIVPCSWNSTESLFADSVSIKRSNCTDETVVYEWSSDGSRCVAIRTCARDSGHTETAEATVAGEAVVPATCGVKGETEYTAVFAQAWAETQVMRISDIPLDADNHAGGTEVKNAKESTCVESGYTGDIHCKGCGVKLTAGEAIKAEGHSFTEYISDENMTCEKDATKTARCDRCDAVDVITDVGTKLEHANGDDQICDYCGKQNDNPATGEESGLLHAWIAGFIACVAMVVIAHRGRATGAFLKRDK